MAAAASIVRRSPTRARGRGVDARRSVAWRRDPRYARLWRPNSRSSGRPSKSPAGSDTRILNDPEMHVSHETIYLSLFVQSRGVLKKALVAHLRQRRTYRRPKCAAPHPGGHIVDAVSIRERPATADDRAVPGHWEGDLLVGARHSHVATLVERRSRYVCLIRLAARDTQTVVRALTQYVQRLPEGLMATLTWDRGYELAHHHAFSIATGVRVYFCDPQSPWQRGTNENTNGLLRQYFPTGTNLSDFSQRQLDAIALRLNTRPRKTLGYRTPADILAETVASTA
jgi:IS30 family transposase